MTSHLLAFALGLALIHLADAWRERRTNGRQV